VPENDGLHGDEDHDPEDRPRIAKVISENFECGAAGREPDGDAHEHDVCEYENRAAGED
jgi:hypothetical protein